MLDGNILIKQQSNSSCLQQMMHAELLKSSWHWLQHLIAFSRHFLLKFPELSYITKTWIIVVSSQEFSGFPQFFHIFQPMTLGFQLSPPPSACRPPWPPRSVAFPALRRRSCERWTFLGAGQRGRARLVRENPGEIVIEWDLPSSKHTKTMENHNF